MDAQEPRNLQEAYMEVVENQQLDEGKMPLDKERRTRIGRQIGRRTASAEHDFLGSKAAFMPKGIRNILRQSATKKVGEVRKMMGALKSAQKNESYDYYDIILSHLLDEGYAETIEGAKVIMVNMSEEWRDSIVEAKSDYTLKGQEKKEVRNIRTFGKNTSYSKSKATKERHNIHRSKRGINKIKGDKSQENLASIINQSSRVHKSKNNGYNRDGSYMDD